MLIVVHGVPGIGKTTLAERLSDDLAVRYIAQDTIKEFYADTLGGVYTNEESDAIGRAAKFSILELAIEAANAGMTLMIEGAFHTDTAQSALERMPTESLLQVYVQCEPTVARERFLRRVEAGERHSVHKDRLYDTYTIDQVQRRYRPFDSANVRTLVYDTTREDSASYESLREQLRKELVHATTN